MSYYRTVVSGKWGLVVSLTSVLGCRRAEPVAQLPCSEPREGEAALGESKFASRLEGGASTESSPHSTAPERKFSFRRTASRRSGSLVH